MIEAVNSVISNAPLLRGNTEQVSSARVELPETVSAGPQAPFVSPFVSVDFNFDTAVLQIRDSDTGDVIRQFPSESALQARQRATAASESTVIQAQESGGGNGVDTAQEISVPQVSEAPPAAQAQIAAQALSAGAQTTATPTSTTSGTSVSVVA